MIPGVEKHSLRARVYPLSLNCEILETAEHIEGEAVIVERTICFNGERSSVTKIQRNIPLFHEICKQMEEGQNQPSSLWEQEVMDHGSCQNEEEQKRMQL